MWGWLKVFSESRIWHDPQEGFYDLTGNGAGVIRYLMKIGYRGKR